MKTILEKFDKFDGIWHFTDRSNIDSIKQHGLLALAQASERGIKIPTPGGNSLSHNLDQEKGLDKYIHLAFVDDHPMLYSVKQEGRIENPVWLKIKSSILLEDGVRFCADVANKAGVHILNAEQAKVEIDFEVLLAYTDWTDKKVQARRQKAIKSEILVPNCIPIKQILGIKNG